MGVKANILRLIQRTIPISAAILLQLGAMAQATSVVSQAPLLSMFEIVSIRPMKQNDTRPEPIDNLFRRGYFKAVNVDLKSLMEIAYDIPDLRMFGGPSWLVSEKFSVEAKADPKIDEQLAALPNDQARQTKRTMIAALLAERFKLAVHVDMKQMSVYAMVIGTSGPKLANTQHGDDSQSAGDQLIDIRPGSDSLQVLAYELSWRLGRPVLDRTGLQDNQGLTLRWRGDEEESADANAPSLFTALQEQLGLKLNPTKSSVPVLMIDHAEKPADD